MAPRYDLLKTAAFVPRPGIDTLPQSFYTLTFPDSWEEPILDLYRSTKPEARRAKVHRVPIRALNAVLRTVTPDVVPVARDAEFEHDRPWLYSREQVQSLPFRRILQTWLRAMNPTDEGFAQFKQTMSRIEIDKLEWKQHPVDLLEGTVSEGGTCVPDSRLYTLLPAMVAERIQALAPYEHAGKILRFKQVTTGGYGGAELMSWPPEEYPPTVKNSGAGASPLRYSGLIRVTLRTVPFSPVPRIHVSFGIRRWVTKPQPFTRGKGISAYLLAIDPLMNDAPQPGRFAIATIERIPKTDSMRWRYGGPEGLLTNLSAIENLPDPTVFVKEPGNWIDGRDGVDAALVHHAVMGTHGIGTGLMPAERHRLFEWVSQALAPDFIPADPLVRSKISRRQPRQLARNVSVPTDSAAEEKARQARLRNVEIDRANALIRRESVAAATGGTLSILVLHQNDDRIHSEIKSVIESTLGLEDFLTEETSSTWEWKAPGLALTVRLEPLGDLGAPLEWEGKAPSRGKKHQQAIDERRRATASRIRDIAESSSIAPKLGIIVLRGKEGFPQRATDPKFSIRMGFAEQGIVTQFLRPIAKEVDLKSLDHRVRGAWDDCLRQVGARFIPQSNSTVDIPENLNQVALWLVKRQVDDTNSLPQFTPIAVLIRPGQASIMACSPLQHGWVPYPELLTSLAGQVRTSEFKTVDAQRQLTARFVQQLIAGLRGKPTLLLTHAQNTRDRWPWLRNRDLVDGRVSLGDGPLQRLSLQGPHLRIVRVATHDRDETPPCWGLDEDGNVGISKGLWIPADHDPDTRVFFSTSEKSSTQTSLRIQDTKLTPYIGASGVSEPRPDKNAWNPNLLELAMIGFSDRDEAERWAFYLHQQRSAEDYRDELKLPLALHVAQLANAYALPYDDEDEDDDDVPSDSADDDSGEAQLAFEF
ncbi:pPIWI_RE module domain-containing protein [Nocardia sp. NPDC059764]|uniref:pPIWI_RE module domain-containing protein n=1 Tax=Nocardia sp. NPDC059764 TaxID=3346939 RepID=UPI0036525BAA